jgi:hypothetical protein
MTFLEFSSVREETHCSRIRTGGADSARCVQCGICTCNCQIGIDVRSHAWRGNRSAQPVSHVGNVLCAVRGVLRFERRICLQEVES